MVLLAVPRPYKLIGGMDGKCAAGGQRVDISKKNLPFIILLQY